MYAHEPALGLRNPGYFAQCSDLDLRPLDPDQCMFLPTLTRDHKLAYLFSLIPEISVWAAVLAWGVALELQLDVTQWGWSAPAGVQMSKLESSDWRRQLTRQSIQLNCWDLSSNIAGSIAPFMNACIEPIPSFSVSFFLYFILSWVHSLCNAVTCQVGCSYRGRKLHNSREVWVQVSTDQASDLPPPWNPEWSRSQQGCTKKNMLRMIPKHSNSG